MFSVEKCNICENERLIFDNVLQVPLFLIIWYLMNCEPGEDITEPHDCTKSQTFDKEKLHKMNVQLFLVNYLYIYYSDKKIPLKEITSFKTKGTNRQECCTVS